MDALVVHTRAGADALAARHGVPAERVQGDPPRRLRAPDPPAGEAPLPQELAAVEGPVVLCFGVVRAYKGVDVLLEAFREVDGAELWVVGRPLGRVDGAAAAPRAAGAGPVRAALRERQRAARVLPPRRPARAAAPARGRIRSAVRRPRLRQGDGALRRGRLPRRGGGARRRAARAARGPRGARRRDRASCSPTRRRRAELGERARAAAAGPYSWDRIAGRTLELYEELVA